MVHPCVLVSVHRPLLLLQVAELLLPASESVYRAVVEYIGRSFEKVRLGGGLGLLLDPAVQYQRRTKIPADKCCTSRHPHMLQCATVSGNTHFFP